MANSEKVVAIDIGATGIKLCEFEFGSDDTMNLSVFAYREYEEELSAETRIGVISGVLRQMLAENNVRSRKALLSLSGQSALLRFGKIPAGNYDRKQILQLAEFEAKRNIPFEINEVLFDYQLIAGPEDNEFVDVMSVVIKNNIVEQFVQAITIVGLEPIQVDIAPVACYNAARANGLGEEECVAILNIGGRSTNLIFIEGDRFFARTIPIAGYSITQQIAKEFGIGTPEAEELKRHHGFVALGGAYAEPTSETASSVSKIIRNVMARLHGEISRSISIYKAQQKGSAPTKIFLCGGSSILKYCDVFFQEKLDLPIEYFNPFPIVNLSSNINREKLGEVAHMFSEVIGLGLRYRNQCPIEISLLPNEVRRQQALAEKKPYFIAAMIVLLLILVAVWQGIETQVIAASATVQQVDARRIPYEKKSKEVAAQENESRQQVEQCKTINEMLLKRTAWPCIINELYRLKPDDVWITQMTPIMTEIEPFFPKSLTESEENDNDTMGGSGGGMFGGGGSSDSGGGMGGMGDEDKDAAQSVTIYGLSIEVTCASTSNPPGFEHTAKLKYPFLTEDQLKEFLAEIGESSDDEDSPRSGKQRRVSIPGTPERLFLENLHASPLFSADPTMTAITANRPSSIASNVGTFTIQIKLNMPLEYMKYPSETLGSDGTSSNNNMSTGGAKGRMFK